MSRRYTFSRTIETPDGKETFTAEQFDSFDEARNAVEKGVRDRRLQFPQGAGVVKAPEENKVNVPGVVTPGTTLGPSGPVAPSTTPKTN